MALGISADVTLVALIVSLIALMISFFQLLGQLLGTAEGYRRCNRGYIGPWSIKTRRKWIWWEFRYETLYATPHIALSDGTDKRAMAPLVFKNRPCDYRVNPIYLTVHADQDNAHTNSLIPLLTWFRSQLRNWDDLQLPYYRGRQSQSIDEVQSGKAVSWLDLLRTLHDLGVVNSEGECHCDSSQQSQEVMDYFHSFEDFYKSLSWPEKDNVGAIAFQIVYEVEARRKKSIPRILYQRQSWDLMPPDVGRPLASSRVGDIVVLALRLGMQWREILPSKGQMFAEGNGFSITSHNPIQGVGCILFFESQTETTFDRDNILIPSSYVDAMACGVLPTCPSLLNNGPLNMVRDDLTVDFDRLLSFLNISRGPDEEPNYREIATRGFLGFHLMPFQRTAFNDVLFLIPPYIPIPRCPGRNILFNGWLGKFPMSVFNFWEGRMALWHLLQGHMNSRTKEESSEQLVQVYERFKVLRESFNGDFTLRTAEAAVDGTGNGPLERTKDRAKLHFICRAIHEWTVRYFQALQRGPDVEPGTGRTDKSPTLDFIDLLAGHFELAIHASLEAREIYLNLSDEARRTKYTYSRDSGRAEWDRGITEVYFVAVQYVKCLQDGYLSQWLESKRGCQIGKADVEAAWWTLMLRGIVWSRSVRIMTGRDVPASKWKDPTRVYFS